jgi:hypothetical protein
MFWLVAKPSLHRLFDCFITSDFPAVPFSVNQTDGNHLVPSLESMVDEEDA